MLRTVSYDSVSGRRRAICHLCRTGFDSTDGAMICPDCVEREPSPLQDNENEHCSNWIRPREAPEITVARVRQIEAELKAHRFFFAVMLLHSSLTSIAGAADKPLRLLPRDQHKLAASMLGLFKENFPDLLAMMDRIHDA